MNLSRTHIDPILLSTIGILFPIWTAYWSFLNFSFTSIALRVSNVYSGKASNNRVNGLIDKLLTAEEKVEI
jgi:hypothetical protein